MLLTENEKVLLQAILDSEYMDGDPNPIGHAVWWFSVTPDGSRKWSGVASSLSQKQFVDIDSWNDGFSKSNEATISITQLGYDALMNSKKSN